MKILLQHYNTDACGCSIVHHNKDKYCEIPNEKAANTTCPSLCHKKHLSKGKKSVLHIWYLIVDNGLCTFSLHHQKTKLSYFLFFRSLWLWRCSVHTFGWNGRELLAPLCRWYCLSWRDIFGFGTVIMRQPEARLFTLSRPYQGELHFGLKQKKTQQKSPLIIYFPTN